MSRASEVHVSRDNCLADDALYARTIVATCLELGMTADQASSLAERSIESRRKLRQ